jgi:tetratricopeptide (TPR) repeat protein
MCFAARNRLVGTAFRMRVTTIARSFASRARRVLPQARSRLPTPPSATAEGEARPPAPREERAAAQYALGNERREASDPRAACEAYRDALALDDGPARYHYRLAVCLAKLGEWEPAARAYEQATARDQRHPRWYFRLGTARRQCGDWAGALEAFETAVEGAGDEPKYHYWLGHARRQLGDLAGAEEAYRATIANGYPQQVPAWYWLAFTRTRLGDTPGAREAISEATAILEAPTPGPGSARWYHKLGELQQRIGDLTGARDAYGRAIELGATDLALYRTAAEVHRQLGDPIGTIRVLEAAVAAGAADARTAFELGQLLEHTPLRAGIRAVADVGLLPGRRGDWERATAAYRAAITLAPAVAEYHYRLGRVRYKARDPEGAVDALSRAVRLEPDRAEWHYRLGRATAALGHRRGLYTYGELEGSNRAYERALELRSDHRAAREQLTRNRIRAAQWPEASRAAWHAPSSGAAAQAASTGPSATELATLRRFLEDGEDDPDPTAVAELLDRPSSALAGVPAEWWFPLHWRLLSLDRYSLAYRAKDVLAERVVAEAAAPLRLSRGLELVRALTYLERQDEALQVLDELRGAATTEHDVLTVRKYAADVRVSTGIVDDHVALLDVYDRDHPGEARFRELVHDARVAIVAPADPELDQGEEIDGFDVVVRTKYVPADAGAAARALGSRTDVSYYAIGSAPFVAEGIAEALREQQLQLVVLRTSRHPWEGRQVVAPGDLRFVPAEYRASFRSSQFAVQRIVYDVIRYRPRTIKVFNANFFASVREYRSGYVSTAGRDHAARGLVRPLSAFAHDHRSDFVFTRTTAAAGLIEVDPTAERLLRSTPAEYLATLDRKRRPGPATPAR